MDRISDGQPDMAVNAAAFVPPALGFSRIAFDGDDIGAVAIVGHVGDIHAEADVAVVAFTEFLAIDPYLGLSEDAVKIQPDRFAPGFRRKAEFAAVPAFWPVQEAVGDQIRVLGERSFHHVVMRKVHGAPASVVILEGCRAAPCAGLDAFINPVVAFGLGLV